MSSKKYIVAVYCENADELARVLEVASSSIVHTLDKADFDRAKLVVEVPKVHTNGQVPKPKRDVRDTDRVKTKDAVLDLLRMKRCTVAEVKKALPTHKASTVDTTLWQLKNKSLIIRDDNRRYVAVDETGRPVTDQVLNFETS